MVLEIDFQFLKFNNLTVNEYIYLRNLYNPIEGIDNIFEYITEINEDILQDKGFIKITESGVVLRSKGIELFENKKDLFYTFLSTFPIKTPKGRYLSPKGTEGVAVDKLIAKWNRLFKNKEALQKKVIKVLEAEIAWRKKNGEFEYMNNIETWLNQANWEKYEYLVDNYTKVDVNSEWQ